MKRHFDRLAALAAATFLALPAAAATRNLIWANRGADMNDAANWFLSDGETVAPTAPTSEDRLYFGGRPGVQPRLTATMQVLAVRFGATNTWAATAASADDGFDGYNYSGWTISGDEGAELVLPGRWSEGKNWNFAFSQSTFGTNVVDVPVRFSSTSTGNNAYRPILVYGGRLVFRKPVASATSDAVVLVAGNGQEGAVAFEAANPDFPGGIRVDGGVTLAIPSAAPLANVATLILDNGGGSSKCQRIRNETGGALSLPGVTLIRSNGKNDNCHFEGDGPIAFPNAVFAPRLNDSREYSIDVPLSVKSIGNGYTDAGAFVFRKLGPATLRVSDDVFQSSPEGQTNRFDLVNGALVLENGGYFTREAVLFGITGTFFKDGARPAIGLTSDLAVPASDGAGAFASYDDQTCCAGFAAYGGNRTVAFYGGAPYQMGADLADIVSGGFRSDRYFRRQATTLVFGAVDADGTVTLANDLDINQSQTHWSVNTRPLDAVQGLAPVAGRIAGRVYNSAGGGNATSRIRKYGDGVLALDGDYELASGDKTEIHDGGLLVNAGFAGPVAVTNAGPDAPCAWLGGIGTMASTVTIQNGGALRPGDEHGVGTLTLAGSLVLQDGARLIVNVGATNNTAVAFTGAGCDYRAEGSVVLEIDATDGLEVGRPVKILDWSGASSPSYLTMTDPARYVFAVPEESPVHHPSVYKDGEALWLKFSVDTGHPFKLLFQ